VRKTKSSSKLRDLEQLNRQSPMGNFFQSPEFYEVLKLANQNPFVVTAPERECTAGLLAYTLPDVSLVSKFFPSLMVYYGPVLAKNFNSNDVDTLLRNLDSEARKRGAIRVDIRTPFPPCTLNGVFEQNGYIRYDPGGEYSVIIDLVKNEDALWKEMKRFARQSVKNATQRNVKIKEVANEQELRSFHQIYLHTAERRDFIPYSFSFFDAVRSKLQPKGIAKFFMAWHGEKPIAGILNVIYNGQSVPFIAASLRDCWKLRPNHLLFWHSICWSKVEAKAQTFKLYHLPKSKSPKNGIDYYTFKTCFGGDLIRECCFYYKVISPLKLQLLEKVSRLSRLGHARQILQARAAV